MVPLAAMPTWLRTASQASPVRWGIVALEGATWRGLGASELALHCGVLVAIGVIAFAVGVIRSAGLDA